MHDTQDVEFRWLERGDGEPVVLLHGLMGRMDHWEAALEHLGDTCRPIALSLPIFDPRLDEVSIEALAQHVLRFLDALEIGRAVIGGNSLGGHVALAVALACPSRVSGLILAGSSGLAERGVARRVPLRPSSEYVRARLEEVVADPALVTPAWVASIRDTVSTPWAARRVVRFARATRRHRPRRAAARDSCADAARVGTRGPRDASRGRRALPHADAGRPTVVSPAVRARADARAAGCLQRRRRRVARGHARATRATGRGRRSRAVIGPALVRLAGWYAARRRRQIERASRDAARLQELTLLRLVRTARDTEFWLTHGLSGVRSVAEYQERVPVREYRYFEPLWARARAGEADVTWPGRPLDWVKTSGTTSGDKIIPVTGEAYRAHTRGGWDALLMAVERVGAASPRPTGRCCSSAARRRPGRSAPIAALATCPVSPRAGCRPAFAGATRPVPRSRPSRTGRRASTPSPRSRRARTHAAVRDAVVARHPL